MLYFLILSTIIYFVLQFKKCQEREIIIVYETKKEHIAPKVVDKGWIYVKPFVQDYAVLPLKFLNTEIPMKNVTLKDNLKIDFFSEFEIELSKKNSVLRNAKNLSGLNFQEVKTLADDIIKASLSTIFATKTIKDFNDNEEKCLDDIKKYVNADLFQLGLEIKKMKIDNLSNSTEKKEKNEK